MVRQCRHQVQPTAMENGTSDGRLLLLLPLPLERREDEDGRSHFRL